MYNLYTMYKNSQLMFEIVCVCMCVLVQVIRKETLEFGIHTRHWPNDRTIIVDTMMWQ